MADSVPMISISAEACGDEDNETREAGDQDLSAEDLLTDAESVTMSDGDLEAENEGEDEMRSQSIAASRLRRKTKKKPRTNTNTIFVDAGEEEGVTDMEEVECDHDGEEEAEEEEVEDSHHQQLIDTVFDAYKPQITEIMDDQEGKQHIKTIIRGVVATDIADLSEVSDDEDREMSKFRNYDDVATDVESLNGSSESDLEAEKSDCQDAMNDAIQRFELGANVHAKEHQEERSGPVHQPCLSLLPPSRVPNRRKTRKTRKSAPKNPAKTALLLGAPDQDQDPVTDIEDLDSVGEPPSSKTTMVLGVPVVDTGAVTEEECLSDADAAAPGIVVDCDESNGECFYSGRSSRMELTDVDMDGSESAQIQPPSMLGLPANDQDPFTDIDDVSDVEEDERAAARPPTIVPCTAQTQFIELHEDEDGVETVVSRKTGAEADRLLAANSIDDATADAGRTHDLTNPPIHHHSHSFFSMIPPARRRK